MIEFVIERADRFDASDWPIHKDDIADVLHPNTRPWVVAEGWGHHRISVAGIEVAFSWEPVGWQVSFEGDIEQDTAAAIVAEIAQNLAVLGIGTIYLFDYGYVDWYNIYRQPLFSKEDLGEIRFLHVAHKRFRPESLSLIPFV